MQKHSNLVPRLPRFGFRNGWLYLVNKRGLFRFQGWPRFKAESSNEQGDWTAIDVALRDKVVRQFFQDYRTAIENLNLTPGSNGFQDADTGQLYLPWIVGDDEKCWVFGVFHWRQFLKALPAHLATCTSRLKCDLFSALELFMQVPAAMDLTQHSPVLATALARHWEFPAVGRVDWEAVREQVRHRRRDIIDWLGFPATESTVNGLERISVGGPHAAALIQRGLGILNDPVLAPALTHVPLTEPMVIECLANPLTRQWLDSRRLRKAGPRLFDYVMALFEPINSLLAAKVIDVEAARRISWTSPDQRTSRWILPHLKPYLMPDAPAPVSIGIERLQSLAELICEGEEMSHCVGSMHYLLRAVNGEVAIYRVTSPVRATLALSNKGQGYWTIEDIKGPHNAEISLEDLSQIAHQFPPEVEFDRWIQNRLWDAA